MMNAHRRINRCAGFFLLDVVTGIVVAMVILVALTVSVQRYRHASRRLADQRAAVQLAERVLTDLQAGQQPAAAPEGFKTQVQDLPERPATSGIRWVEVRVEGSAVSFSLVGLIPVRSAEGQP